MPKPFPSDVPDPRPGLALKADGPIRIAGGCRSRPSTRSSREWTCIALPVRGLECQPGLRRLAQDRGVSGRPTPRPDRDGNGRLPRCGSDSSSRGVPPGPACRESSSRRTGPTRSTACRCDAPRSETEYGEPVDWAAERPAPVTGRAALCRCGRSSTKPFCDDTHETRGFDGTEVADRATYDERAATFPAARVRRFDLAAVHRRRVLRRPVRTRGGCSTGRRPRVPRASARWCGCARRARSSRDRTPTARRTSRRYPVGLGVVARRPVLGARRRAGRGRRRRAVRGAAPADALPVRHSENKPFCDGSHKAVGFTDA